MIENLIAIGVLCLIVWVANLQQANEFRHLRFVQFSLLVLSIIVIGLGVSAIIFIYSPTDDSASISLTTGIIFLVTSLILGLTSIGFIYSMRARQVFGSLLRQKNYRPSSVVHTTAMVMMIVISIFTIGTFILTGGIDGVAEQYENITITIPTLLTPFIGYILVSFVGVGIFIRRDIPATLRRLGIQVPENSVKKWLFTGMKNLCVGVVVGFGLFWVQVVLGVIWQLVSPPELLAEQTAATQAIFDALSGSLWLGFMVAFTAGVGEELFFRGALQPIFGNLLISVFFVILHSQYLFTPATLIIFVVSIVFGLLREHYTTPTAMMAHFVYNFTPFVLIQIVTQLNLPIDTI